MEAAMEAAMEAEKQREMDRRPLGVWKVDPVTDCAVLEKPLGDAPERWLRWAAPYLDPALMDVWAPEPVVLWSNIAGVLRCSERQARKLGAARCFLVDQSDYRAKTTLREIWTCLSRRVPQAFAP